MYICCSFPASVCAANTQADREHQQQISRRRYNNQSSLFASIRPTPSSLAPPREWQTTAAAADGEETFIRRDAAPAALSGFCAAAAAAAATSAIRKSHFNHVVEPTDRWRLEREAFRVKVREHVGRELARMATQAAASLAVVAEAEERGSVISSGGSRRGRARRRPTAVAWHQCLSALGRRNESPRGRTMARAASVAWSEESGAL